MRARFYRSVAELALFGQAAMVAAMEQPQFWFNTRTKRVETEYDKSQSKDLLGPYASQAEAEQALASASRRTEDWDEADRRWREGDPE